jgi:hypothetical protein
MPGRQASKVWSKGGLRDISRVSSYATPAIFDLIDAGAGVLQPLVFGRITGEGALRRDYVSSCCSAEFWYRACIQRSEE